MWKVLKNALDMPKLLGGLWMKINYNPKVMAFHSSTLSMALLTLQMYTFSFLTNIPRHTHDSNCFFFTFHQGWNYMAYLHTFLLILKQENVYILTFVENSSYIIYGYNGHRVCTYIETCETQTVYMICNIVWTILLAKHYDNVRNLRLILFTRYSHEP